MKISCHLSILGVLIISGLGCRIATPERSIEPAIHPQKDIAFDQNKVRLRMRALVDPLCSELEQSADAIISGSHQASVQKAALRWKIEGVPALRTALLQPDGIAALGDAWALCNQMADYFESGSGKNALGDASVQALITCRRMEEEIATVAASITVSGDIARARAFARDWAKEHPIQHSIAGRESTQSRILERELAGTFSTGEAVAEITMSVDDLNRKLDIYSAQLFRQARWELEQFRKELLDELSADKAVPLIERTAKASEQAAIEIERLTQAIQPLVKTAGETPKLLSSEREVVLQSLRGDFNDAFKFLREERLALLEQISKERIAALKGFRDDLDAERIIFTREMEQISFRVVDHVIWRIAQLLGIALALFVIGIAGLNLIRRRRA